MKNKIEKLFTCIISLVLIILLSPISLSMQGINTSVDDFSISVPKLSAQDIFWPSNSSDWIEVAPETQGLDSDKIAEIIEFVEDGSHDLHSIIIVRNGFLLTEEYFYNSTLLDTKAYFGGETTHMQQSATKGLMSILIGIALQEGFLDNLNQTLYEFFANIWEPDFINSTSKKDITIEQLLKMNSGLGDSPSAFLLSDDCIKWALELIPLEFTPGEGGYIYSSDGPNLLSGIITNVTGKSTEEFAQEYLFTPLGISEDEYYWWNDSKGMKYGGYGFNCTPKVQAKLGILSLNNGTWDGIQIVGEEYMKDATTPQITSGKGGSLNEVGYSFYMMNSPFKGYYMAGAGGQFIYVIPEYNITIGLTAGGISVGFTNDLLSDYIIQFAEDNAPEWDQMPEDQLIQEEESLYYDVNASDTSGVEYSINDTVNFGITSEGIITNSTDLSVDVYPLEIRASNTFNNSITATINIKVESIPSSTAIPGFDLNMIFLMVFCTSVVLIIRRRKSLGNSFN